jgi:hypothetical protein
MRRQELDAINRDQGRIRENMKTLKGSAEEKDLVQRYTRQLNSQEDRLATLNKETAICKTSNHRSSRSWKSWCSRSPLIRNSKTYSARDDLRPAATKCAQDKAFVQTGRSKSYSVEFGNE